MSGPLAGHVALVTGASSGIGEATAIALGAAGATVVAVARRSERLMRTVARIETAGGKALALPGDVSEEKVATQVVAEAVKRFGRLDILVNSAGLIQAANVEHADTAQWRRVLEVNLLATLYTCHAALGPMRAQGSGNIINIGSLSCRTTSPIYNSYATSKFGLNALTDGLRQEVGPHGIRVCMIAPGPTRTEVAEGISDPVHREAIRAYINQPGALQPEDVAATVLFIVSMPPRANVSEVWLRATTDVAY
ncbi:MAG TPA: SDR family NAD(P)-dependent oxidoreductase [Steroidobacteraceae bacterium]|nr:SDR family NAD(P)-dependent oxidoreductase [Steroidobacteraceae bacterium]